LPRSVRTAFAVPVLIGLAVLAPGARAGTYNLQNKDADITFTYTVGFVEQRGHLKEINGVLKYDKKAPQASSVNAVIRTTSLTANSFEDELKGSDFFNVAEYPEIRFVSASVNPVSENSVEFSGNLTMRGVTQPVTLRFDFEPQISSAPAQKSGPKAPINVTATGHLKRSDFGMTALGLLVDDDIEIVIKSALQEKK
jgi:polyisoprenoid-binding protein YceI